MNIFFLTETESGCYKWRAAIPGKYLRRRGHTVQLLSKELRAYEAPDVLVISRAHFAEAYKIVPWCKKNSIRIVFDTDDALDMVPRDSLYYKGLQDRLPLYDFLLEEADIVTTTTETLAEHLRNWNPNVAVVPNSFDPEEWQVQTRAGSGLRVGWSGATNHFVDLLLAVDAIRDLQKKYDFTFVIQGICEEASLESFYQTHVRRFGKAFTSSAYGKSIHRLIAKMTGIKHEFHPQVDIGEHPRTVCGLQLDIGIAPLLDSNFNRFKSCVKYYEYAMAGAVTLASDVLPYSTEVPTTARNTRDAWTQRLEDLLNTDRESMQRSEREWVFAHRNIEQTAETWERVLQGDLSHQLSTQLSDQRELCATGRETTNEAA